MAPQLDFVVDLTKSAGQQALKKLDQVRIVKTKQDCLDICTNADLETESYIAKSIQQKFPGHNIIREEEDNIDQQSDYTWTIDAIDGTSYFAKGIKFFATSVGLWHQDKPLMGVVYNPGTNDCYYAERGKGAFLDQKKLGVSSTEKLLESIIQVDLASFAQLSQSNKDVLYKRLQKIVQNCYRFRSYGCGSLALCYLAQGYLDAYFDLSGREQIEDLGAGLVIATEAGARTTDLGGKYPGLNVNHVLVTNGKIHQKMLQLLAKV